MDIFDSKKAIFDFNYGSALGDATMQRAYFGKKIWMREVEAAKKPVHLLCDRILHGDFHDQTEYDNEFYKVGYQVCDAINAAGNSCNKDHPNEFTFGNAQKLINMTMKHIEGAVNQKWQNRYRSKIHDKRVSIFWNYK